MTTPEENLFDPDADLSELSPAEMAFEVMRLRAGIREHRDRAGHDLCWYVPELWGLLPEKTDPLPDVPATGEFLNRCAHFRRSLGPDAPVPSDPMIVMTGEQKDELLEVAGYLAALRPAERAAFLDDLTDRFCLVCGLELDKWDDCTHVGTEHECPTMPEMCFGGNPKTP